MGYIPRKDVDLFSVRVDQVRLGKPLVPRVNDKTNI